MPSLSPKLREAWYGGARNFEGYGMGSQPIIGSYPEAFVEPKIEGRLVRWSTGW